MSPLSPLQEIEQRYHHLVQAGSYVEAMQLATREMHRFPYHSQKIVYLWRVSMACLMEDTSLALHLLDEAAQAGHWYSDLADETELQILHGLPEFDRLAEVFSGMRAQAIASAVPVMRVLRPEKQSARSPLLLALHGGQSNIEKFAPHWTAAVNHGWRVALPQSAQEFGPGTYSWHDWDWARQEIQKHYWTLCAEEAVDPDQMVLAGFSQGGGVAAWLALCGLIPVKRLLLVGPFLPDAKMVLPWLEEHPTSELRVYLVGGERDRFCLGIARGLAEIFNNKAIPNRLDIYPDLDHPFPRAFEQKIPQALDFLMKPDEPSGRPAGVQS